MSDEPTFARITNREIYDAVMSLQREMQGVKNGMGNIVEENEDLKKRVRGLELKFYGILTGIIGAVALAIANILEGRGAS